jgi:hypothetical protein
MVSGTRGFLRLSVHCSSTSYRFRFARSLGDSRCELTRMSRSIEQISCNAPSCLLAAAAAAAFAAFAWVSTRVIAFSLIHTE